MIGYGLAGFFALLAAGLPIFLVLGLTALILFWAGGMPLVTIPQKMVDDLNSVSLLAVPFFMMAATFMQRGGIAGALISAASAWVGSVRGGLGVVCVVATTLFAAICGSSVATAMAMGAVLVPAMLARRYDRPFAVGLVGASGTLGILIPPSLAMIVYGIIAEESVPRLFLAGVVPGLLQAALFVTWTLFHARRRDYPQEVPLPRREFVRVNLRALPALMVPVLVLGGIYSGAVTVTEAAALAALVSLVVSIVVYRGIALKDVARITTEAATGGASIMLIIAAALVFGHWLTESGIPARLVGLVRDVGLAPWQFLLLINVVLLFLGMFLEVVSVMLISLPLIIPVLGALSIDPVHFAVIITVNMELALLTPPVGLNLYVLSSTSHAPVDEVARGVRPFIALLLLLLLVVTYVPQLSLWLPRLVFG